jgi:hypothetical protein
MPGGQDGWLDNISRDQFADPVVWSDQRIGDRRTLYVSDLPPLGQIIGFGLECNFDAPNWLDRLQQ